MLSEKTELEFLITVDRSSDLNQRQVSDDLGYSLGKVNYCIKALVERGFIKVSNFKNSDNKLAYSYLLTPSGMMRKTKLIKQFIKRKRKEYELLENELESVELTELVV